MRQTLVRPIESRDGTLAKDSILRNFICDPREPEKVMKRPAMLKTGLFYASGQSFGVFCFNDRVYNFSSTTPTSPATGGFILSVGSGVFTYAGTFTGTNVSVRADDGTEVPVFVYEDNGDGTTTAYTTTAGSAKLSPGDLVSTMTRTITITGFSANSSSSFQSVNCTPSGRRDITTTTYGNSFTLSNGQTFTYPGVTVNVSAVGGPSSCVDPYVSYSNDFTVTQATVNAWATFGITLPNRPAATYACFTGNITYAPAWTPSGGSGYWTVL